MLFSLLDRHGRRTRPQARDVHFTRLRAEALEDRRLLAVSGGGSGAGESPDAEHALELFATSPALFVENQGQWGDESVRYLHSGRGASVAMTDDGIRFQLSREVEGDDGIDSAPDDDPWDDPLHDDLDRQIETLEFSASYVGANTVQPIGLDAAASTFNYFVGEQSQWRSEVPSYEKVAYEGLYEGIDLHTWGLRSHLKYEFHVAPGADWSQIQVRYEGIAGLSLTDDGALAIDLGGEWGVITDEAPYIYQVVDGQQVEVPGQFVLVDELTYAFDVGERFDPTHALVIDPDVDWSTYLGGSSADDGYGIAVDSAGNVLVTGLTESPGWVAGGFDTSHNPGTDAFVVKLSSSGQHLWRTYLGGSGGDIASDIAVDAAGNALVTGYTLSSGWVSGGFDTNHGGKWDAFVAKLGNSGSHLWSTYLGGSEDDWGWGIAVDSAGNVLVTGETRSPGWVSGGFDTSYNDGSDSFVAKLSNSGSHLWSTYLGGSGNDTGQGIAVDLAGNVLVTCETRSPGWVSGGFDTSHNDGSDSFVAKLSNSGSHVWSTYLGGSEDDEGYGIAVDSAGNVLVTGRTQSSGWVVGGYDTTHNGFLDAFVARIIDVTQGVAGRHLFYNNSAWDGNGSVLSTADYAAIAPDKVPLLPGGTGSFANTSGFFRGITGVIVDLAGAGDAEAISAADFEFRTGTNNNPAGWTPLATEPNVVVRPGEGTSGTERILLAWPDTAIRNTWLQVTVLANERTGLAENDVFYFASVAGETGQGGDDFGFADTTDQTAIRTSPTLGLNIAQLDNPLDIDRSKKVDSTDRLIIRTSPVIGFGRVLPITVPGPGGGGTSEVTETTSTSRLRAVEAVFAESLTGDAEHPLRGRLPDGHRLRRAALLQRPNTERWKLAPELVNSDQSNWESNGSSRRRARMDRDVLERLFEQRVWHE